MKTMYALSLLGLLVLGCDVIAPENARQSRPIDNNPTPEAKRIVLVEDFTGHQCGNCPRAGEIAKELAGLYKTEVAIVAIHAGFFARTNTSGKYSTNFTTPVGNAIDQFFGASVAGLPKGMVNRTSFEGSVLLGYTAWAGKVADLLEQDPEAFIELSANYNADSRKLSATAKTNFLADLDGEYKIAFAITEDGIVSWQKDYALEVGKQDIADYRHDHVLRDMPGGEWGLALATNPTQNQTVSKSFADFDISSRWNDSNLHLVAYIYKDSDKSVIQAASIKIPKN